MHLQMAWRNIWRNPRRTGIILTAVVIGVWGMVFLGALSDGIIDQMVRNSIATLTGSIQIHHKKYCDDPVIENSMNDSQAVIRTIQKHIPENAHWAPRIRVNAVAGNARHSSGVTFVGIDPSKEADVSFIAKSLTEGRYLASDDPYGILVGKSLADKFETGLDRKILIMTQAADKEMASRAFRIAGIFRAELEATEKQFVFVTLSAANNMLKIQEISEISLLLPDKADPDAVAGQIRPDLPESCEIRTWQEILPLVRVSVEMNQSFMIVWYAVVFIAMGFGIVNTLLMAVFERMREFGLLKALGMKPWRITVSVLIESFFLLLTGVIAGNAVSLSLVWWLAERGIDLSAFAAGMEYAGMPRVIYPMIRTGNLITANLMVLVPGLLISLYPALKAAGFTPVEAMSQH
ncbi:MAG: ABC transporter permease [Desulfococcaceae bacterium]